MIENQAIAKQISLLMLEIGAKLDASVIDAKPYLQNSEFLAYRRAVGRLMGIMLLEVMNPLYQQHPDLKPSQLEHTHLTQQ